MLADQRPITSVRDLLAPHDAEFIRAAYEAVLGRAPDAEGGAYYLARLRSGIHKLEILGQLRRSPEGRKFTPGIARLDRAIRRHRRANLPLIGAVIRALTGTESNSATARQIRALNNAFQAWQVQNPRPGAYAALDDQAPIESDIAAQSALTRQLETLRVDSADRYHIEDFMHLYDANFVRFAYRCILKREADPIGLQHYVNQVRLGTSRTQIVHDIRHSAEGRERAIEISGLSTLFNVERLLNLPLIGTAICFIIFNVNIKRHLRDLRNIENQIHRLSSAVGKYDA